MLKQLRENINFQTSIKKTQKTKCGLVIGVKMWGFSE